MWSSNCTDLRTKFLGESKGQFELRLKHSNEKIVISQPVIYITMKLLDLRNQNHHPEMRKSIVRCTLTFDRVAQTILLSLRL